MGKADQSIKTSLLTRIRFWIRELRELWVGRRAPRLFVAVSTHQGVRYIPLPECLWGTKSHEFWVFLTALLHRIKPESILELGSGRSSIYLSEYAGKYNKEYISIDESEKWASLNHLIAGLGSLQGDYFHCVPLDSNRYYDEEEVLALVKSKPDFVYLDGPAKGREGFMQQQKTIELCRQADVVIIDDIMRTHVYDQMDTICVTGRARHKTVFRYEFPDRTNYLAVLASDVHQPEVERIINSLEIQTISGYTRDKTFEEIFDP